MLRRAILLFFAIPLLAAEREPGTAFAVAIESHDVDTGAKVNHRDPQGGTALSVAVLDVVKTLIDSGAGVQRDKADLLELAKDKPEIRAMIIAAAKKK